MAKTRKGRFYDYKTPKPASETKEGKERERAYFAALGRFVHMFAKVESSMALALWYYAKTPHNVARAVFSGVRVKEAAGFIGRLTEVAGASDESRAELKYLFDQLSRITSARNDLLHYGAVSIAEGNAAVTNALKALDEARITSFPVSPDILADMTADLIKIIFHLHSDHMGRRPLRGEMVMKILRAAWRYKHQPQPLSKNRKEPKSRPPHKRAPN